MNDEKEEFDAISLNRRVKGGGVKHFDKSALQDKCQFRVVAVTTTISAGRFYKKYSFLASSRVTSLHNTEPNDEKTVLKGFTLP